MVVDGEARSQSDVLWGVAPRQLRRDRAAGGPVEQLDRMDDRNAETRPELHCAADIAGGDDVGFEPREIGRLAVAKLAGDFGLEDVVCARRPAAEMRLD